MAAAGTTPAAAAGTTRRRRRDGGARGLDGEHGMIPYTCFISPSGAVEAGNARLLLRHGRAMQEKEKEERVIRSSRRRRQLRRMEKKSSQRRTGACTSREDLVSSAVEDLVGKNVCVLV